MGADGRGRAGGGCWTMRATRQVEVKEAEEAGGAAPRAGGQACDSSAARQQLPGMMGVQIDGLLPLTSQPRLRCGHGRLGRRGSWLRGGWCTKCRWSCRL